MSKGYEEAVVLIMSLLAFLNGLSISGQNVIDGNFFIRFSLDSLGSKKCT